MIVHEDDESTRIVDVKPTRFQWLMGVLSPEDCNALRLCHETYPLTHDVDFGWSLDSPIDEVPSVRKYIQSGFVWEASVQGDPFWLELLSRYPD